MSETGLRPKKKTITQFIGSKLSSPVAVNMGAIERKLVLPKTQIVPTLAAAAYPTTFLDFLKRHSILITSLLIVFTVLGILIWKLNWYRDIEVWFQTVGPSLEKWFKDPKNDWMYLIFLVILLGIYRKFPAFFAPATCVVVMGLMVLICFQYNNFNAKEVINKWLIVGLFVLPVPPVIFFTLRAGSSFVQLGAMAVYILMVVLLVVINPGKFLGKFSTDGSNVYVVGLIGLFAMLCVFLNRNFMKDLWPSFITKLGFVLISLLAVAFTFQYAIRFFMQKPNFSANYLMMLAILIGGILLFCNFVLRYVKIPDSWKVSRLIVHVVYCYIHDFFAFNAPMAFYILLVEKLFQTVVF